MIKDEEKSVITSNSLRQRGGAWFAIGAQQLHVGVEDPFQPARKAHLALRVAPEHLDALAVRLRDAGIEVSWNRRVLPGTRRFYSKDPWGNRIEFLTVADGTPHCLVCDVSGNVAGDAAGCASGASPL